MKKVTQLVVLLTFCHAVTLSASDAVSEKSPKRVARAAVSDLTVAIVNGRPISSSQLDRHVAVSSLQREEALEDLIDLQLVRAAVVANKLTAPAGKWSEKQRAEIEYALAQALLLNPPAMQVSLVVDHAWLKDATDDKEQAAGRARLERLRALVVAGATIPQAYARLQVDGTPWHIGDHEEYPAEVLPPEARDLPIGSLSGVIPGDGGLHLFRIYQVKKELPSSGEVHGLLLEWLRRDARIEYP